MSSYQNGSKHALLINDSSLSVFPKTQGCQYIISTEGQYIRLDVNLPLKSQI